MQAVVPMHDESESEAERDESSITSGGWACHAVLITPELLGRLGTCETVSCVIMPEEVPARPLAVRIRSERAFWLRPVASLAQPLHIEPGAAAC